MLFCSVYHTLTWLFFSYETHAQKMSNDLQYFTDIIEVNCCLGWSYENGPFQMYLLINCLISSQLLNRPFCYSNESRKKEKQNKKRKNTAKKNEPNDTPVKRSPGQYDDKSKLLVSRTFEYSQLFNSFTNLSLSHSFSLPFFTLPFLVHTHLPHRFTIALPPPPLLLFFRVCIPFIIIIKYERAKWCTYAAHLVSFQCGLRINNGISLWLNSVCGTVFSVQCSLTCSYIPMSYIFIYK